MIRVGLYHDLSVSSLQQMEKIVNRESHGLSRGRSTVPPNVTPGFIHLEFLFLSVEAPCNCLDILLLNRSRKNKGQNYCMPKEVNKNIIYTIHINAILLKGS